MKKILSWVLCLTLILGLAGCGTQQLSTNPNEQSLQAGQSESSAPVVGATEAQYDLNVEDEFNIADNADNIYDNSGNSQMNANTNEQNSQTGQGKDSAAGEGNNNAQSEFNVEDEFNIANETEETMDFSDYMEDKYHTSAVPEGQQQPVEPENQNVDNSVTDTCFLTIRCDTILNNMDLLTPGKEVLIPSDGVILARTEVAFHPGESVFQILQRETTDRLIHMESSFTPMYNSAYIEGLHNLYEFDCGSESGWMYCVNGWFPNYGVSRYEVQPGDEIEFHYTCDLGRDVGGDYWDSMQ